LREIKFCPDFFWYFKEPFNLIFERQTRAVICNYCFNNITDNFLQTLDITTSLQGRITGSYVKSKNQLIISLICPIKSLKANIPVIHFLQSRILRHLLHQEIHVCRKHGVHSVRLFEAVQLLPVWFHLSSSQVGLCQIEKPRRVVQNSLKNLISLKNVKRSKFCDIIFKLIGTY